MISAHLEFIKDESGRLYRLEWKLGTEKGDPRILMRVDRDTAIGWRLVRGAGREKLEREILREVGPWEYHRKFWFWQNTRKNRKGGV